MNGDSDRFIACGMYAFTDAQQDAWQQLFDHFFNLSSIAPDQITLRFEHGSAILREPGLWFGHTCGYPLVSHLQEDFSPFCVPLFDVQGTEGRRYSSRIIVGAESGIQSLAECRSRGVAMNNSDSNSGMNVLRRAVAGIHDGGSAFFSRVITSGGHLHSLEAVASGAADVAAIDCVSYQLIADWQPDLVARVRVIGDTVKTCGLPLVMPLTAITENDTGAIVDRLNQALTACDGAVRATLHLTGFTGVRLQDYHDVVEAEQFAIARAYPELR
jgi:ABC-type phosphate/phosphonate transport system substrate-binding protein